MTEPDRRLPLAEYGAFTLVALGCVAASVVLDRSKPPASPLQYELTDTVRFKRGVPLPCAVSTLTATNTGLSDLEDVVIVTDIGVFRDWVVTPPFPAGKYAAGLSDGVNWQVPVLRPGESISMSMLTSDDEYTKNRPEVKVTGKGVVGVDRREAARAPAYDAGLLFRWAGGVLLGVVAASALMRTWLARRR